MDPYNCRVFDHEVTDSPVLRVVFALASPNAAVLMRSIPVRESPRNDRTAKFTAYDIRCAGASHEMLNVVREDEDGTWKQLLKPIRNPRDEVVQTYLGKSVLQAMRQMQPLASKETGYMKPWTDIEGRELELVDDAEYDAV